MKGGGEGGGEGCTTVCKYDTYSVPLWNLKLTENSTFLMVIFANLFFYGCFVYFA